MSTISFNSSYSAALYRSNSSLGNKQANPSSKSNESSGVLDEFLAYQKLTPQQKIRESILKEYGLTEENLQTLSPETRKRVEADIREEIEKMVKPNMAQKGILVDITV